MGSLGTSPFGLDKRFCSNCTLVAEGEAAAGKAVPASATIEFNRTSLLRSVAEAVLELLEHQITYCGGIGAAPLCPAL